jgi:putative ABC transport system permease protein
LAVVGCFVEGLDNQTLALGIGVTTAVFGVASGVLVRPLPYPHSDRVFVLGYAAPQFGSSTTGAVFHFVGDRIPAVGHFGAYRGGIGRNLVVGDRAEYVRGLAVSSGYFDVFGVLPRVGRGFTDVEDQANGPAAVVLSDAIWRRYFDGGPDVIGSVVQLGGNPYNVVGVMPDTFHSIPPADIWTPLRVSPQDNTLNYTVVGRLRDDATAAHAAAQLDTLRPAMLRELPDCARSFPRRAEQMAWVPFQQVVAGSSRVPLLLLLGARPDSCCCLPARTSLACNSSAQPPAAARWRRVRLSAAAGRG